MTIRYEDLKKNEKALVKNPHTGEIERVVNFHDTEIGTEQVSKDLTVHGDILVDEELTLAGTVTVSAVSSRLLVQELDGRTIPVEPVATSEAGGRLTLTSGTPVATSDVTSASTLYYTPFTSGRIALYDGSLWRMYEFSETSLTLSSLTSGKNYDVYAYANANTVTLELGTAWSSDTARAEDLERQNGVLVKSGTPTRRYLGTIRTTSTTTTEDSVTKRFVWNYYNQMLAPMYVVDANTSWAGGTANTWRQARASTNNQVEFVCGDTIEASAHTQSMGSSNALSAHIRTGVGVDSTSTPSAQMIGAGWAGSANLIVTPTSRYRGRLAAGYHYLAWLEYYESGTATWYGNPASGRHCGITAEIMS